MSRAWVVGLALALSGVASLPAIGGQAPDLPEDPDRAAVVDMCSNCHGLARSIEKRHAEAEWRVIVADMRDKGAPGSDDDAAAVVRYLTKHFGT